MVREPSAMSLVARFEVKVGVQPDGLVICVWVCMFCLRTVCVLCVCFLAVLEAGLILRGG